MDKGLLMNWREKSHFVMENAVAVHSQMFSPNVFIVGIFITIIIII